MFFCFLNGAGTQIRILQHMDPPFKFVLLLLFVATELVIYQETNQKFTLT